MSDDRPTRLRLRLREFSLPLRSPLGTAKGEITERRGFVVAVERGTGDGDPIRGVGEAAPLPPWTEGLDACREALVDVREWWEREGTAGLVDDVDAPAARHAVTLAVADAAARRDGVPLAHRLAERSLVDGSPAETVPVNAIVGDGSVGETVSEAEAAVADGFDCLKLKVGARALDEDLARLRAAREAVGDDVALRADANGAWGREEAERAVDALADFDFEYVEQPLPADDCEGLAALRGRGVDVAVDETLNGTGGRPHLPNVAQCADVAVLKPMAQGGVGATVSLARHLRGQGVTPVVTTTVDAVVARTAAVHAAAAIPDVPACGLATGGLLEEDLASDPAPVEGGEVRVPQGPGLAGESFDGLVGDDRD